MNEEKRKNKSILKAFSNATNGIIYTISTQKNVRIQIIIALIVMLLSYIFKLTKIEIIVLVITVILVLFAEMINTAIETVVDLCTESYNQKAKIAKDVAAGAVVLASVNAVIVGFILFFDKIIAIIKF